MGGECALSASLFFLSAKSSEHCKNLDEIVICFLVLYRPADSDEDAAVNRDVRVMPM
jgi:hypothetical protein